MALDKGTTLAGYRIEGVLGQGGMGTVYEATQLSLNRTIALKLLAQNLGDDPAFRERFRREGLIQASIDHPNIVTIYEAGASDEGLFLAMRLVRGPNLKDLIISRELDAGRALRILAPVAEALDVAHESGLIHRDIKPQNILVGGRDHAYLADFGLTKAPGEKGLTKTGQFVGTLDYISPEQIRGLQASKKSDIYALAAVLYECLTGVVPYAKDSEAAVLYAHMSEEPPAVTGERPELPGQLDAVIRKAMSKDPDERHESATALMHDAQSAFTTRTRAAMSPPGPISTPEEAGIRAAEVRVSTRESGTQRGAGPTHAHPPDLTRPAVGGDPTQPAVAGGATVAAPGATRARGGGGGAAATEQLAPTGAAAAVAAPPAERRAVSPALLAVAAVVIVALAIGGFVAGHSGSSKAQAPANNSSASVGALTLTFPDTWTRAATPPQIPGLALKDSLGLSPKAASGGKGSLVAGTVAGPTGATLLPDSFVKTLPSAPQTNDGVKLNELQAYRYKNLQPKGYAQPVTVYAAPTSAGALTVACSGDATFQSECERVASTLTASGATGYPLGVPQSYVTSLNTTFSQLSSAQKTGLAKLRSAKTPAAQKSAAATLASAYGSAAGSLTGHPVPPQVSKTNAAMVAGLRTAHDGYAHWPAGRAQVARGDAAVSAALKTLGR